LKARCLSTRASLTRAVIGGLLMFLTALIGFVSNRCKRTNEPTICAEGFGLNS
jgi:hypothetical protein